MHTNLNHRFGRGYSALEARLIRKTDRTRAYEAAAEAESGAKIPVTIRNEQVRALDSIVRASNAGWPEWAKWTGLVQTKVSWLRLPGLVQSSEVQAYNAMLKEARKRIQAKCPELDAGWFRWIMSKSTRTAYWTAESQMMQAIAEESKAKLEAQDGELQLIQQRYSKNSKLFAEGGVRLSLKNTPKRSKLLKTIEGASKITEKRYASYKDFPPEVKSALQDEETLVEDLVTRYGIIEPSEVDRLFTDNQNGGSRLKTRLNTYFKSAEYRTKSTPGAQTLREMDATGRGSEVKKIETQLLEAIAALGYRVWDNRKLWHYRSLHALKNPNASADTKWKYLMDKKPVAGTRITLDIPSKGKIVAFTKCKDGEYFRCTDARGDVYLLDIGPAGQSADEKQKFTVVGPPKRGSTDPVEIDLPTSNVEISPR